MDYLQQKFEAKVLPGTLSEKVELLRYFLSIPQASHHQGQANLNQPPQLQRSLRFLQRRPHPET